MVNEHYFYSMTMEMAFTNCVKQSQPRFHQIRQLFPDSTKYLLSFSGRFVYVGVMDVVHCTAPITNDNLCVNNRKSIMNTITNGFTYGNHIYSGYMDMRIREKPYFIPSRV